MDFLLSHSSYIYAAASFYLVYLYWARYSSSIWESFSRNAKEHAWTIVFAVLACLFIVLVLDRPARTFMQSPWLSHARRVTSVGNFLGKGDKFMFPFGLAGFIVAALAHSAFYRRVFAVATTAALLSGAVAIAMKIIFARARPFVGNHSSLSFFNWGPLSHGRTLLNSDFMSMASGETMTAFALFTPIFLCTRKRSLRLVSLAVPLIVCFSRLQCGAHWLSDIFAGAGVGTFVGLLFWRASRAEQGSLSNASPAREAVSVDPPLSSTDVSGPAAR